VIYVIWRLDKRKALKATLINYMKNENIVNFIMLNLINEFSNIQNVFKKIEHWLILSSQWNVMRKTNKCLRKF
jgi:hypothetical protein